MKKKKKWEGKRDQSHILCDVPRGIHPVNKRKFLPGIKELQERVCVL